MIKGQMGLVLGRWVVGCIESGSREEGMDNHGRQNEVRVEVKLEGQWDG